MKWAVSLLLLLVACGPATETQRAPLPPTLGTFDELPREGYTEYTLQTTRPFSASFWTVSGEGLTFNSPNCTPTRHGDLECVFRGVSFVRARFGGEDIYVDGDVSFPGETIIYTFESQ